MRRLPFIFAACAVVAVVLVLPRVGSPANGVAEHAAATAREALATAREASRRRGPRGPTGPRGKRGDVAPGTADGGRSASVGTPVTANQGGDIVLGTIDPSGIAKGAVDADSVAMGAIMGGPGGAIKDAS